MAVERTLIEHYAPSSDFARFLQGRYVTEIDDEFDTITLDDGTVLEVEGNEGCGWCRSGWYDLVNVYKQGSSNARIMSAHSTPKSSGSWQRHLPSTNTPP